MLVLPAVLIFGAATFLLVRARQIGLLEVMIVGLFGFFLATSGLAHGIAAFIAALGSAFTGTGH